MASRLDISHLITKSFVNIKLIITALSVIKKELTDTKVEQLLPLSRISKVVKHFVHRHKVVVRDATLKVKKKNKSFGVKCMVDRAIDQNAVTL